MLHIAIYTVVSGCIFTWSTSIRVYIDTLYFTTTSLNTSYRKHDIGCVLSVVLYARQMYINSVPHSPTLSPTGNSQTLQKVLNPRNTISRLATRLVVKLQQLACSSMRWSCRSICLSICLSSKCIQKHAFSKTKQFRAGLKAWTIVIVPLT